MMAAILLYHAVSPQIVDPDLQVSPNVIRQHLDWSVQLGFRPASLLEALADTGSKTLAVTFDDGLASIAPTVRELVSKGIVPTVFLCPGHVGGENRWASPGRVRERLLTLEELLALRDEGIVFGCHGWDHRPFLGRDAADLTADLERCMAWFETKLSVAPTAFAWPFGRFDETSEAIVATYFSFALSVNPQWNQETGRLSVPRVVPRNDSTFVQIEDELELKTFQFT